MPIVRRITPCLWFDCAAEAAARFYVSVFERALDAQIGDFKAAA